MTLLPPLGTILLALLALEVAALVFAPRLHMGGSDR